MTPAAGFIEVSYRLMPIEHEKPAYETVMDVTAEQVARVYAQAFISATVKSPDATGAVEQLTSLIDVLDRSPRLEDIFRSALISHDDKAKLLDRVFGKSASPIVLNFLKVLSARARLDSLRPIARLVEKLDRERRGMTDVEVRVARELADDIRTEIHDRIRRALGTEPVLHISVDPDLIAGIWVRVGDRVFDGSVRTQLERARRAILERATEIIETNPNRFFANA
jgi:F-type H+-transporting ATPase subunit delta